MIGMVLAAGAGRRLQPWTETLPKTLLPVDGDRTILDVALGNFARRRARPTSWSSPASRAERVDERLAELGASATACALELVFNAKAEEWNNAYSLWCAREHFARGRR